MKRKKYTIGAALLAAALLLGGCTKDGTDAEANRQTSGRGTKTMEGETLSGSKTNEGQTEAPGSETVTERESTADSPGQENVTVEVFIQAIEGKILLLADSDGLLYQLDVEGLELKNGEGQALTADELSEGMGGELVFDGITMRNYPATIPGGISFTVDEMLEDPYSFYVAALEAIWEDNDQMNEGVDVVALDLTESENLTRNQREVVRYLMGRISETEVRLATEDELELDGTIDDKRDCFADGNGVLIKLEDERERDGEIRFEVEKWRSDRERVEYEHAAGTREEDGWRIELGKADK